jgi:hypothetical protein
MAKITTIMRLGRIYVCFIFNFIYVIQKQHKILILLNGQTIQPMRSFKPQ